MAKSPSEPITMPSSGRWDWNDETKTLEFIRFEAKEEVKEKKKTNTSKSQEQSRKPLEKWQTNTCLLRFYSYAAWVTFERRGLKGIRMEIGCLFGSNVFNPAPNESKNEWKDQESSQKSPSKFLNSRQTSLNTWKSNRLPPLNKIITQRSPLMVSLLPTPQEKAPHLFERSRGPQVPSTEDSDSEAVMEELKEQLKEQLRSLSFGILGRPLRQFSPETLKPQESPSEEETENEEDEGSNSKVVSADPRVLIKTSVTGQRSLTTAADKRMRSSRADLVSRATTEAVSSDTE